MNPENFEHMMGSMLLSFVFVIVLMFIRLRHKERMAVIAKGGDPYKRQPRRKRSLRVGMLMVCISLGLMAGMGIYQAFPEFEAVCFIAPVLLFVGSGLVAEHVLEMQDERHDPPYKE
ncbi:MAG: DUF6249 domain-containing protein [Bacteroidota bacterium]